MTNTTAPPRLRPIGTVEVAYGFHGRRCDAGLFLDDAEGFWAKGTNPETGQPFRFPLSDHYVAMHCNSIGTAPQLRRAA